MFNIGDKIKLIVDNGTERDYYYPNRKFTYCVFKGQSLTTTSCFALEFKEGKFNGGGAQNGWWNLDKSYMNKFELVSNMPLFYTNLLRKTYAIQKK